MCWSWNFVVSLLLDWLIVVDDFLKRCWWDLDDFDANYNDNFFVVVISETMTFHYCFLDESLMILWRDIVEALIISKETFLIFIVFVVLTSEWLIFHCWFFDNSLMILWRIIEVTPKILMQTKMILKIFFDQVSGTLMFHCCFVNDWLMIPWKFIDRTAKISIETLKIPRFFCANLLNLDALLLVHWWLVGGILMKQLRWRCKH